MTVNSFSRAEQGAPERYYCTFPADPSISENDLMYRELANKVDIALHQKGFTKSVSNSDCGQAIFIGFGYGAPITSLAHNAVTRITKAKSKTLTPAPETTFEHQSISFARWLVLISIDAKEIENTGGISELWKVIATTPENRSVRTQSLQKTVTFMLAGAMDYIGKNNPQGKRVRIRTRNDNWETLN